MDDFTPINEALTAYLRDATQADPLRALTVIGQVQRHIATHQRDAVRAAAQHHSWTEIGDALGVSKQAAHQKFAKEWAETLKGELKTEVRAFKTARRMGSDHEAAAARARMDEVIAEFKTVGRRR
jgi:hypothetical protein